MNTCDTCKWWEKPEPKLHYGEGKPLIDILGRCGCDLVNGNTISELRTPYGTVVAMPECDAAFVRENDIETTENHHVPINAAEPFASDDYGIGFATGPKFGCVHHEPK